jgi:hypothetical protein
MQDKSQNIPGSRPHSPNTVRQYRAQLFDADSTITITSTNSADVSKKIQSILGGTPRFVSTDGDGNVQAIFHDAHLKGTQPCGWIAEWTVPEVLSVKNLTDQRMAAQRAA